MQECIESLMWFFTSNLYWKILKAAEEATLKSIVLHMI